MYVSVQTATSTPRPSFLEPVQQTLTINWCPGTLFFHIVHLVSAQKSEKLLIMNDTGALIHYIIIIWQREPRN